MSRQDEKEFFAVKTPIGFRVSVTLECWLFITSAKHPVMVDRDQEVIETLKNPSEVRRSRIAQDFYLFYRPERQNRWVCAVAKRVGNHGFLITTYPTDAIKEGERVWPK